MAWGDLTDTSYVTGTNYCPDALTDLMYSSVSPLITHKMHISFVNALKVIILFPGTMLNTN